MSDTRWADGVEGYWSPHTATIDWCELNYQKTPYIAEFYNTISNALMVFAPLTAVYFHLRDGLEFRMLLSYLGLTFVGIGSTMFHATLVYSMQLLDELPMIYATNFMLYSLFEMKSPPKTKLNRKLAYFMLFYSTFVTVIYTMVWVNAVFHQVAYGLMVFTMVIKSVEVVRSGNSRPGLLLACLVCCGLGFVLWNIDNHFCTHLRAIRASELPLVDMLTQLHAAWHLLTGLGAYLGLLFIADARALPSAASSYRLITCASNSAS